VEGSAKDVIWKGLQVEEKEPAQGGVRRGCGRQVTTNANI